MTFRMWLKELRDNQSQAHNSLHDAVEELRDCQAWLNMVQNNEKRRVSWNISRIDHVEDGLKAIGDAIQV